MGKREPPTWAPGAPFLVGPQGSALPCLPHIESRPSVSLSQEARPSSLPRRGVLHTPAWITLEDSAQRSGGGVGRGSAVKMGEPAWPPSKPLPREDSVALFSAPRALAHAISVTLPSSRCF